jgi:hypothetical protein
VVENILVCRIQLLPNTYTRHQRCDRDRHATVGNQIHWDCETPRGPKHQVLDVRRTRIGVYPDIHGCPPHIRDCLRTAYHPGDR